jgi:hypothetical protein
MLARLQACLCTLAPGVVYTFPFGYGATPRTMVSDLGGGTDTTKARVFSMWRGIVRHDTSEFPMVEIVTPANEPDTVTALDDQMFERVVSVQLWAYVDAGDASDSLQQDARPDMNTLLADLQIVVEAFPYWTDTGTNTDPLYLSHGPITITRKAEYTVPALEQPEGMAVLSFSIAFKFHRLNP